jgi:hypothetical protein
MTIFNSTYLLYPGTDGSYDQHDLNFPMDILIYQSILMNKLYRLKTISIIARFLLTFLGFFPRAKHENRILSFSFHISDQHVISLDIWRNAKTFFLNMKIL